ncbi:MAG: hypothetical protein U1F67_01285 [Rubrivivax sp.]
MRTNTNSTPCAGRRAQRVGDVELQVDQRRRIDRRVQFAVDGGDLAGERGAHLFRQVERQHVVEALARQLQAPLVHRQQPAVEHRLGRMRVARQRALEQPGGRGRA